MKDKDISEQDIQLAEGDSAVKSILEDTRARIKDKSKDEISNTLFSSLRTYSLPLIMMLANLAAYTSPVRVINGQFQYALAQSVLQT